MTEFLYSIEDLKESAKGTAKGDYRGIINYFFTERKYIYYKDLKYGTLNGKVSFQENNLICDRLFNFSSRDLISSNFKYIKYLLESIYLYGFELLQVNFSDREPVLFLGKSISLKDKYKSIINAYTRLCIQGRTYSPDGYFGVCISDTVLGEILYKGNYKYHLNSSDYDFAKYASFSDLDSPTGINLFVNSLLDWSDSLLHKKGYPMVGLDEEYNNSGINIIYYLHSKSVLEVREPKRLLYGLKLSTESDKGVFPYINSLGSRMLIIMPLFE